MPVALAAEGRKHGLPLRDPEFQEFADTFPAPVPLLPVTHAHAPPDPFVGFRHRAVPFRECEVRHPPPEIFREFPQPAVHRHAPASAGQSPDPPPEAPLRFLRPDDPLPSEREPEEIALRQRGDLAFRRIDRQPQLPFKEACEACHHPPSGAFTPDQHEKVVRVSHEPVSPPLQFHVQIVKHDIGQQRRERPALRHALSQGFRYPVFRHSGAQIAPDEPKHDKVRNLRGYAAHENIVVDRVEKPGQVHVQRHRISLFQVFPRLPHRVVCAAPRSEPVTEPGEPRLEERFQHLRQRLLYHAVEHRRDAEGPPSAAVLRDIHPPDRLRTVRTVLQRFPDRRPFRRAHERRELLDGHPVHPRRTRVRPDPFPGPLQVLSRKNPRREHRFRHGGSGRPTSVGSAVRLHRSRCDFRSHAVLPFGPSLRPLSRASSLLWPLLTPARRPADVSARRAEPCASAWDSRCRAGLPR